jgi:hypothetical protein
MGLSSELLGTFGFCLEYTTPSDTSCGEVAFGSNRPIHRDRICGAEWDPPQIATCNTVVPHCQVVDRIDLPAHDL